MSIHTVRFSEQTDPKMLDILDDCFDLSGLRGYYCVRFRHRSNCIVYSVHCNSSNKCIDSLVLLGLHSDRIGAAGVCREVYNGKTGSLLYSRYVFRAEYDFYSILDIFLVGSVFSGSR